ncbi:MAG: aminotransferase class IV [Thermoleophilia bacterium]|nr:aminotransferase class IV [Thermoleophilia bacterium]
METEMLYLSGTFMPLSEGRVRIEDRGFQLGDGIYEVIKVMNGRLVWPDDHLARLERNLGEVSLADALRGHDMRTVLPRLVTESGVVDGMVYVQVTRGYAPREFVFPHPPEPTVLAYARSKPGPTDAEVLEGSALHPVEDLRWARCDIKTTNLLPAVLAKEEARNAGAQEALFVSSQSLVREGGSSNVFAFLEGVLRTHPLNNRILAGITRKYAIEFAEREGYVVEERAFTLSEVTTECEPGCEVFSASTTRDIMPVVRIGSHVVGDGRPGRVTLALLDVMRREQALLVGLEPPPALS